MPCGSPAVLEKLGACHHRNGLGTSAHSQLAINTAHLGLYRVEGDNEGLCNLSVGASSDEQAYSSVRCLLFRPTLVKGHYVQAQELNSEKPPTWMVKVLFEALQHLDSL